jgi:hypothetical protein
MNGFTQALAAVLPIAEYGAAGAIMWAGWNFMFGNRTKAQEYVLGASIGFIMALKAWAYVQWLKGVAGK